MQQVQPPHGQHRLAAILAADVVGYTRLMEADERGTHDRLMHLRFSVMEPIIARHRGRVIKNTGDGFLAMFDSALAALEAAQEMQRAVIADEAGAVADRRIAFRMGVNVADVIVEDHDIYGDGVNVAARLQSHAEPGGIVISGLVAEHVGGTLGMRSVDLGQMHMRNRAHPVRVLSLRLPEAAAAAVGEVEAGHEARPSIAVLPFRKLATADDGYFADGIVDNIIHALAALKELFVIARGSTLGFGSGAIDVRAIGRELGVRYVLYGSVQRSGERLRIGTELSDVETGEVMRADHYDGELGELFQLQDRIAEEVVKMIAPRVRERELKRALRKHPQNMTAYDLVLQSLDPMYRLDYASFSRARGLLQRAMTIDPSYAPAYSYAAWWHSYRIGQEWSRDFAMDAAEAIRLSERAIALDENDALALATHGHEISFLKKDFNAAIEFFDRALRASPNSAISWVLKSATLGFIGDGPGALECASKGLRLSPIDRNIYFAEHILAQAHYINGDFDEAVLWCQRADEHNGRLTSNMRALIVSLVSIGKIDKASEVAKRLLDIAPHFSVRKWAARTPLNNSIKTSWADKLREAGLPD